MSYKRKEPMLKKCACGNDAVGRQFNQPVCARCKALEHDMDWMHKATCGVPEPRNGNTLNTYHVSGLKFSDHP